MLIFFINSPSPERLAYLIRAAKNLRDDEIKEELAVIEERLQKSSEYQRIVRNRQFLSWSEARDMAKSGLIRFGSHSKSHRRLDKIQDEKQIEEEVYESRQILKAKIGSAYCDIFCYPNGSAGEMAQIAVRRTYSAACTVTRGNNKVNQDLYKMRRIGVHQHAGQNTRKFLSNLIRP